MKSMQEYVQSHVATVRDVELLTGLKFFTTLSQSRQARLKTQITRELW